MTIQEVLEKYKGLKCIGYGGGNGINYSQYKIENYVINLIHNNGKKKIKIDKANFNESKFEQLIDMEYRFLDEIEPIISLIINFANKEVKA